MSKAALPKPRRGTDIVQYKYGLAPPGERAPIAYALSWEGLENPIVYDAVYDAELSKYRWYTEKINDMVRATLPTGKHVQMNNLVARELAKLPNTQDPNLLIRFINGVVTDNRASNLACAGENNAILPIALPSIRNPPAEVFVKAGITEFPRYVSWYASGEYFQIKNHPILKEEVNNNVRSKPVVNGTRSKSIGAIDKYQDILGRLKELDDRAREAANHVAPETIAARKEEYAEIVKVIQIHDGTYVAPEAPAAPAAPAITPERLIAPGRSGLSRLPADCGVTQAMLPKYVKFSPGHTNHGSSFEIVFKKDDKTVRWRSRSNAEMPVLEKFRATLDQYRVFFPEAVLPELPPRTTATGEPAEAPAPIVRGRIVESRLPANSGITQEMLPRYVVYTAATDKRGDSFEININRGDTRFRWRSTTAQLVSTPDKFRALLVKYRELFPDAELPEF